MSETLDHQKIAEFIAAAGISMAQADKDVDIKETEYLYKILIKFTEEPEKYLYFNGIKELQKRLDAICDYWGKRNDNYRYCMLGMILGIACADDEFLENERNLLYKLADHLKIDEKYIRKTLQMEKIRVKKPSTKPNLLKTFYIGFSEPIKAFLNKLSFSQEHKIAEFVASTGMLIMTVDGNIDHKEIDKLNKIVSNFTSQPKQYLSYTNEDILLSRIQKICTYWSKKNDYYKHFLMGIIESLATVDGVLHERELMLLNDISKWLKIEE